MNKAFKSKDNPRKQYLIELLATINKGLPESLHASKITRAGIRQIDKVKTYSVHMETK